MSGSSGTPGPGYAVTNLDTEGAVGNTGAASSGTQNQASNADTSGTTKASGAYTPAGPPPVTEVDTSGTNSANGAPFHPVDTSMHSSFDTSSGGITQANPAYRAPSVGVPASVRDTTRTDVESYTGGSSAQSTQNMTGNIETMNIGAAGTGTGASAPAAPAKPTAVSGPRSVTVTWAAVPDVAGDPTLEYIIENSRGGRSFAGKNQTSHVVTTLDPSYTYAFRVAARNRAGIGPFSPYSDAVRAYNPDEPDVLKAGGLDPKNVVNPVYRPDGSIMPGTGGTPA